MRQLWELVVVVLVVGLVVYSFVEPFEPITHEPINGNEDVDASGDGDGKIVILALFNGVACCNDFDNS